jgi:hypothetical protein
MNILDPIFYRTLFYDFRPVISPGLRAVHFYTLLKMRVSAVEDWSYMLDGRLDLNKDMGVALVGSGVEMNCF